MPSAGVSPFNGRVIFDHLPKTAGQSVNAWLRTVLGEGNVTDNMISEHRLAIRRFGGEYAVISGHISFEDSRGLDRRYQYTTCCREPIDRAASWIYFLLNNHGPELGVLFHEAKAFVDSDGSELGSTLNTSICDLYVNHFGSVTGSRTGSAEERLNCAIEAALCYDVVGFYDDLPAFTRKVARLLKIAPPPALEPVNVTISRPKLTDTSPSIIAKLDELTQLDQAFYQRLKAQIFQRDHAGSSACGPSESPFFVPWQLIPAAPRKILLDPRAAIEAAVLLCSAQVPVGRTISVKVDVRLNSDIEIFEIGIHVYDEDKVWAFGTNSTLLAQSFPRLSAGTYSFIYTLIADLPLGKYSAGFALADKAIADGQSIVWHDELIHFEVTGDGRTDYAGYRRLPAAVQLVRA